MRKLLILVIAALAFATINGQTEAQEGADNLEGSSAGKDPNTENQDTGPQEATPHDSPQNTPSENNDNAQPEATQAETGDTVKPEPPSTENNNQEATKQPLYVLVPAPNPFPNLGNSPFYMRPVPPHYPQQPIGPYPHPPPYPPQHMGLPPHHPPPFLPPPMPLPFNQPPMMPFMQHPMMFPSPPSQPPMMVKPGDSNQSAPQLILLNEQKNPEGTVTGQSAVYLNHDGNREIVIIKK